MATLTPMHRLLLAGVLTVAASLARAEQVFQSGPQRVALIELYTSEGCSSCPPAEAWLATLARDPGLWRSVVPVAMHVNYWDHLGWRDALATREFTDREYAYADAWHTGSVYTPCFVRDGAEWHPQEGGPHATATAANAGRLTLTRSDDGRVTLVYVPAASSHVARGFDASVALLGGGIVTRVRGGENAGRDLRHEFVALRFATVELRPAADGGFGGTMTLPPRTDITAARHAIAAWVTARGAVSPLQATGGWLD
jgi:hypothetical protein